MEKRYKVLRFVATLWKILAWIILVIGVLSAFGALLGGILGAVGPQLWSDLGINPALMGGGVVAGIFSFLFILIATTFYFLIVYATGEIFSVFIAIEENTRATKQHLERLGQHSASPPTSYTPPPPA